ncbi:hypothetical protein, partial [Mesorhizobium sp. M7A.F.Ca.ET.027.03.2.1]|uniref:hypothetical protein n=1 Tax=Mesorhizobium sp. M7A.F.Ca.ET.027.03.2.1 TaxID=2496656 RepID=UPI001AEC77F4
PRTSVPPAQCDWSSRQSRSISLANAGLVVVPYQRRDRRRRRGVDLRELLIQSEIEPRGAE